MDVFRFINPTQETMLQQGIIINGLKSKLWVERFTEAGEFKFVADVSSGAQGALPIGSLISHTDSKEVMIVEDHQISEMPDKNPEITITGRSLDSFLENRTIYDTNLWWSIQTGKAVWKIDADYLHNQVFTIINRSINIGGGDDKLIYISPFTYLGSVGEQVERPLNEQDSVYTAIVALMKLGPLGLKCLRPGPWTPWLPSFPYVTAFLIHKGVDVSNRVVFSADSGDITNADYLWSNRSYKTTARVVGQWLRNVEVSIPTGVESLNRRVMYVDGKDIYDQVDVSAFTTADWDIYMALLTKRGEQALAAQKNIVLTRADVSHNFTKFKYRVDFDIGDLVTVNGNYNTTSKMRVTEHVEIEDETGQTSYPTLTLV